MPGFTLAPEADTVIGCRIFSKANSEPGAVPPLTTRLEANVNCERIACETLADPRCVAKHDLHRCVLTFQCVGIRDGHPESFGGKLVVMPEISVTQGVGIAWLFLMFLAWRSVRTRD